MTTEKGQAKQVKIFGSGSWRVLLDACYAWSECHDLEQNIFPFGPLTHSWTASNSTTRLKTFVILSFLPESQSLTLVKNWFHNLSLHYKLSPKIIMSVKHHCLIYTKIEKKSSWPRLNLIVFGFCPSTEMFLKMKRNVNTLGLASN